MTRPFGFVVACDMPLLDPAVIRRQLEVLRASQADAVVPVWDSYLEPLHAVYSQDCLPAVRRQIESGDLRIRRFFDSVNVLYWDVVAEGISPRAFANVNTKSELVALLGENPEWRAR
jgi:molybdopterin-guanine dinucleotide biosynthesis protein A